MTVWKLSVMLKREENDRSLLGHRRKSSLNFSPSWWSMVWYIIKFVVSMLCMKVALRVYPFCLPEDFIRRCTFIWPGHRCFFSFQHGRKVKCPRKIHHFITLHLKHHLRTLNKYWRVLSIVFFFKLTFINF